MKKKWIGDPPLWLKDLKFMWMSMKLIGLLVFVGTIAVSASSYSQKTKIDLRVQNVSVSDILQTIEKNTKFIFIYDAGLIETIEPRTISVRSQPVETILDELFRDTGVGYYIDDRQVFLYQKEELPVLDHVGVQVVTEQPQKKEISGTVKDEKGNPLPGVSVVLKGTTTGTITDAAGKYIFQVPLNAQTLVFSFVGMKSQEIQIGNKTVIYVVLAEETMGIEEVVAVGYGTMKKKDLTGAVSSVSGDVIDAYPSSTISNALQGRVSGVHAIKNSGVPGADLQIRIRGTNSISGDNSPLWIIDGFPGDQNMISMSDIENIDILKDASATAIYGSRGANGVIIVTTKRGKAGETMIEYTGNFSMQSIVKKVGLMNANEYMLFANEQQLNDTGKEYFTQQEINNAGEGTDWQDLMYRVAPMNDHSLTIQGGNEKTKFSIAASYLDQKGILVDNDGYQKISLRANIEHNISKVISISYNSILTRVNDDNKAATGDFGEFALLLGAPPTHTPYNEDGTYRNFLTQYPFSYGTQTNMVMWTNEVSNEKKSNYALATLDLTLKPLEGLSIKLSGNVTNIDTRNDYYQSSKYIGAAKSTAEVNTIQNLSLNSNNILSYQKTIGDHNFTATGAITYEENKITTTGTSAVDFLSDNYETHNLGAGSIFPPPSSNYSKWSVLSYLGRINYAYKDKYLATVSFRTDGSSRYSEGNKWGYFPSGALAWRISEEDFMKNESFISNLKLRVGYGETGSTAINPYSTLNILTTGKVPFNKNSYTFFAPRTVYPGSLKWETTAQTDVGLDIGLFDNRINITADYYIKNTRDLLNSVQMPRSTGYNNTIMNIGEIQNKGFDFQVESRILNHDFKWDVSANISINRNKVVKIHNGEDIFGNIGFSLGNDRVNIIREGEPISSFYGYLYDGLDQNGYPKYKDTNSDGSINVLDKTIIGNPSPDFIYGFNSFMSYKNFNLTFYIQGSYGNEIFCESMSFMNFYGYSAGINRTKDLFLNHWKPETPDAKYPRISYLTYNYLRLSDDFIYDGSYIRLKNIQLAYNIPLNSLGFKWIKYGQIYVSAQNLITITNYPWIDPDICSFGGGVSINQGIDAFSYPSTKSFTLGIKLRF